MKKLSLLLVALQFISLNLLAYTGTMFQWTSPNGQITQNGGKVSYVGIGEDIKINYADDNNASGSCFHTILVDGQASHQADAVQSVASGHILVTLMDALEEGDAINITAYQNSSYAAGQSSLNIQIGGMTFAAESEGYGYWYDLAKGADDGSAPNSYSYTVGKDFAGESSLVITLDEGEAPIFITEITVTREYENVEMTKRISCVEDYLNSFCFPYTVTCEGTQFYYFDGVYNGYVYGTPVTDGILKAGVPYLFVPSGESIIITRTDDTELAVAPKHYHGIYGNHTFGVTKSGKQYKVLGDEGLMYCSDSGTNIKQYGCYFVDKEIVRNYTNTSKSVCLSSAAAFIDDPVVTDIDAIAAQADSAPVYNLNGQRVSGSCQGGVYIINGKKVVRK